MKLPVTELRSICPVVVKTLVQTSLIKTAYKIQGNFIMNH